MIKLLVIPIVVLILFFIPDCCVAQDSVIIHGYAPKMKNGTEIILSEFNPFNKRKPLNVYKLQVVDKKFKKQISVGKGDFFRIEMGKEYNSTYLEPGNVKMELPDSTLAVIKIIGSKAALEAIEYGEDWKNQPVYNKTRVIQNEWLETANEITKARYDSAKTVYDQQKMSFTMNRIKQRPASYINSSLLYSVMDLMPEKLVVSSYLTLNKDARENHYGKFIKYNIDSLFINGTAPDFVQSDTSGNVVNLHNYRGKYLLLDFWASWCVPCRAENPNVLMAYQKFKERNFDVLAVSVDKDRKLWLDAIKADRLPWTQISDLQAFSNQVALKYRINQVPSNYLISPDGKIIAKDLRGKALIETLERILQ